MVIQVSCVYIEDDTHIFFYILRFDSLVGGVGWVQCPEGEAVEQRASERVKEREGGRRGLVMCWRAIGS